LADHRLLPAAEGDMPAIRALIHDVGINPSGLDWRRFVVVRGEYGELLGCGQLKPHTRGVMELASIAVREEHQRKGIGGAIIRYLMESAPRPLFLMCRPGLESYYGKFGFVRLGLREMPAYFQRLRRMAMAYERVSRSGELFLVMKLK